MTKNTTTLAELIDGERPNLEQAYIAGYMERELDVRESDTMTKRVARKKAQQWVEQVVTNGD
jgi:hypothetical protein